MQNKTKDYKLPKKKMMSHEEDLPFNDEIRYILDAIWYLDLRDKEDEFIWISMKNRDMRTPPAGI